MLQKNRMSVLCDIAATMWNAVQREEVAVSCEHRVSLRRVTVLGDQLRLQHVNISYVCVVCLLSAHLWCAMFMFALCLCVRARLNSFVHSVKLP